MKQNPQKINKSESWFSEMLGSKKTALSLCADREYSYIII